jgi:ATP-binding cassette subfamily B protein RaxB
MIRTVLQTEAAECSLACLAMISAHFGAPHELQDLRRRFSISLKGANLKSLISHAKSLDLSGRALRVELDELNQVKLPCILHWDFNHFVVLEEIRGDRMTIHDPKVGKRQVDRKTIGKSFTGVALELLPTANFQTVPPPKPMAWRKLIFSIPGMQGAFGQIFAAALLLELFSLAYPMLQQIIVDDALPSSNSEMLRTLAIGFILLTTIQAIVSVFRGWMIVALGQRLSFTWKSGLFEHLTKLPYDFFSKRHLGDIVSRFESMDEIQKIFSTKSIEALLDGLFAIAALLMLMLYSPKLLVVTIVALLVYILVRIISFPYFRMASTERLVIAAKANSHFLETLRAIAPIKLFAREGDRLSRWQNLLSELQNRDFRTARYYLTISACNSFVFGIEYVVVFWLGAEAILSNSAPDSRSGMTIGALLAYIGYRAQFASRVSGLVDFYFDFRMLAVHSDRIADIALEDKESDLDRERPPIPVNLSSPQIRLIDVGFRHADDEPWVLSNINLTIDAGEFIAILGASGSGKTTLVKIVLGLLSPTVGQIQYYGTDIRIMGLNRYRAHIGAVLQEDNLIAGTIFENIAFLDLEPDQIQVEKCAAVAQIHREISSMPMGFQTLIGDMGAGLSGGQKQRVMMARALYKQPSILVLDEATSHLDIENELALSSALSRIKITRIVVAHRPQTIAAADRRFLMNAGQLELLTDDYTPQARTTTIN